MTVANPAGCPLGRSRRPKEPVGTGTVCTVGTVGMVGTVGWIRAATKVDVNLRTT